MLTIYTKPGCHPCRLTIKTANKLGLNYQEKPAKEHTGYLATLGHASAPVIVDEAGNSFSGFRPD
ncbi:TPA: glutaredoxin family protein, partial [Corynebacterium striatum]|nr:glutaredoxin family protein [Corynebacterium striatum]HAT1211187.1 glutaredoxin family protein [Corynebacterium striatum]HAT1221796.1 glutaredoxin family protein [Corynebacterium striatum]HAT1301582.1 glutaredoxin family protein [Corynebacterium striatum]HAT1349995.1 glutaredoxin family protein [Corynebacterium striatum]